MLQIQNKKVFLTLLVVALTVLVMIGNPCAEVLVVDVNIHTPPRGKPNKRRFEALAAATNASDQTTLPWIKAAASGMKLPHYLKYDENKLSPIRDQGTCASCWSIGVTGILADRISVYTNGAINEELSKQEMISCWDGHQKMGCSVGGIPELAYNYVIKNGIALEADFPYAQEFTKDIAICKAKKSGRRVFAEDGSAVSLCVDPDQFKKGSKQYNNTIKANIANMKQELYMRGPIVGTLMIHESTYDYDGLGVYKGSKKANDKFIGGHVVIITGYADAGANTDEPGFSGGYWICKQSWGLQFPSKSPVHAGYMFVDMGTNCAGIESRASACMPVITREIRENMVNSLDASRFTSYEAYKRSPGRHNFVRKTTRLRRALGW
ncbi:unnamed protein product [Ectocarpus sp. 6 AP-2014]